MRKDISFSMMRHPITSDFSIVKDSNAIRQSMKNIIFTNLYERGFNKTGASLKHFLFELTDELALSALSNEIKKLLVAYETDVEIVSVDVYTSNDTSVLITVSYTEYNNPETQTLSIPIKKV